MLYIVNVCRDHLAEKVYSTIGLFSLWCCLDLFPVPGTESWQSNLKPLEIMIPFQTQKVQGTGMLEAWRTCEKSQGEPPSHERADHVCMSMFGQWVWEGGSPLTPSPSPECLLLLMVCPLFNQQHQVVPYTRCAKHHRMSQWLNRQKTNILVYWLRDVLTEDIRPVDPYVHKT